MNFDVYFVQCEDVLLTAFFFSNTNYPKYAYIA